MLIKLTAGSRKGQQRDAPINRNGVRGGGRRHFLPPHLFNAFPQYCPTPPGRHISFAVSQTRGGWPYVLTTWHNGAQLAFAVEHRDWQVHDWRPVLFLEEQVMRNVMLLWWWVSNKGTSPWNDRPDDSTGTLGTKSRLFSSLS